MSPLVDATVARPKLSTPFHKYGHVGVLKWGTYVVIMLLFTLLLMAVPGLATWLPGKM